MTQTSTVDPSRCPVCGARNSCAVETGSRELCWCAAVELSEQALARIPDAARGLACLCPRCAAFQPPESAGERKPTLP